jgi:pyrroline-5-carboxylate reductase
MNILLIGCGNMGSALAKGWLPNGHTVSAVEPNTVPFGVVHYTALTDIPQSESFDVIVLAVKPQQLDSILPSIASRFGTTSTYLTIAAGKKIAYYQQYLGSDARIIRAMPNMPAVIEAGMTALFATPNITNKETIGALMDSVGSTAWLLSEEQMDAVTAISGSGPAYFFTFMAALVEAGVKQGLTAEAATHLVLQTAVGASILAAQSDIGLCDLAKQVTSKGGTTEAALNVFNHNDALAKLVDDAVAAAIKRSRELA